MENMDPRRLRSPPFGDQVVAPLGMWPCSRSRCLRFRRRTTKSGRILGTEAAMMTRLFSVLKRRKY